MESKPPSALQPGLMMRIAAVAVAAGYMLAMMLQALKALLS
jgi:hypothetical protein